MRSLLTSLTQFFYVAAYLLWVTTTCSTVAGQELLRGFVAAPNPTVTAFQPLLSDPTNTFSLSFLRVNRTQLALAVIHVASGETLWFANMTRLARWAGPTQLTFNGSLVISDTLSGVFWSTNTDGDRVLVSNSSNLQILKEDFAGGALSTLWQSFDFPSDTLVENQNFTSAMTLVSSNGLYTMRLGSDFIGFYADFNPDKYQLYYRHGALEAKADIIDGQGPIYIRISSDGYLGMYQNGSTPVDIQPFNSYQRSVPGIRRVRFEPDGNLKGYYWSGSGWVLDYQAISEPCDLPSPCGSYGLCRPGDGGCSCLDNNRTETQPGQCYSGQPGNFCNTRNDEFWVLRRAGVELPYKELMGYVKTASLELCEKFCETNCTCWGAVYSNASGFCYTLDYPIQTLVEIGDESKVGYFKVREVPRKRTDVAQAIGIGLLCAVIVALVCAVGFGSYKVWKRKRRVNRYLAEEEEITAPGPYKNLGSSSPGSIELISKS
ncbi:hypothetical protein Nepgr_011800 [Nepenthes gracilis]|uniref:Apple domain-containing protein n=1 Tax=Nepenthes gracilis TaxID=150966 RepID=A0AAD3XML6_NEPGR|nr:hypothetical protein Nepgr_011800 [Nepenthes gracilis]